MNLFNLCNGELTTPTSTIYDDVFFIYIIGTHTPHTQSVWYFKYDPQSGVVWK